MSSTTKRIKAALSSYGHMLKNTYIPSHKKKQIRVTMKGLERELARLEKEEKIAQMQHKIAKTRTNITKLNAQSKGPSAYSKLEKFILSGSPDYWGGGKGKRRGGGMDFGLDWNW